MLKLCAENVMNKGITKHKRVHEAKLADLTELVYEWFKQYRSENVTIYFFFYVSKHGTGKKCLSWPSRRK